MELTVDNLALVSFHLVFLKYTVPRSLTIFKISLVSTGAMVPNKLAFSVHDILLPLTIVDAASMWLCKASLAMSFAIFPISLVNITVRVSHSTSSIVLRVLSLPLVKRSVLQFHFADPFPLLQFLSKMLSFVLTTAINIGPIVIPNVQLPSSFTKLNQLAVAHHGVPRVGALSNDSPIDHRWLPYICDSFQQPSFEDDCLKPGLGAVCPSLDGFGFVWWHCACLIAVLVC